MKKLFTLAIFCFCGYNLLAQTTSTIEIPDYTYKSPEAQSFQRQDQFQVGEYTGSVDISFPLYSVKYKDIELPITLSYNSTGVKVESESSWVGLNWDLNVGGCVNLVPAGAVDRLTRAATWEAYKHAMNLMRDTTGQSPYSHVIDVCLDSLTSPVVEDAKYGLTERDFYQVALPNGSFYFFLDPENDDTPKMIGPDDEQYLVSKTETGWKVIDADGFIYEFNCTETSVSSEKAMYTSAWYLTSITSPTMAVLNLEYSTQKRLNFIPKLYQVNNLELDFTVQGIYGVKAADRIYPIGLSTAPMTDGCEIFKPYLERITTEAHDIQFILGERDDIAGQAQKLESIIIKSSLTGKTVKTIEFDYRYHKSEDASGGYYSTFAGNSTYDYTRLRMLLDGFRFTSGNVEEKYEFEYNEYLGFPCKASCAQDLWGYYNGQKNYVTGKGYMLVPEPTACDIDTATLRKISDLSGADRKTYATYVDALSLKKITFPTKGYTTFTFEPNRFLEYRQHIYEKKTIQTQDINYPYTTGGPTIREEFTLGTGHIGKLKVTINSGDSLYLSDLKWYGTNLQIMQWDEKNHRYIAHTTINLNDEGSSYDLSKTKSVTKELSINLPAGKYFMISNLPSIAVYGHHASVAGSLSLYSTSSGWRETLGAGLRIKEICSYDSDDCLKERVSYDYVKENGTTSGIQITPNPLCEIKRWKGFSEGDQSNSFYYVASVLNIRTGFYGMSPFVSAVNKNNVGYSRVKKSISDGNTAKSFVSTYQNDVLPQFYGECTSCQIGNGNLLTRSVFDENGKVVSIDENRYISSLTNMKINFSVENRAPNTPLVLSKNEQYILKCYPFQSFWNRLTYTKKTTFTNGATQNVLETSYEYDKRNHKVSTTIESTAGYSQKRKTLNVYSTSSDIYLVRNHILNALIRKQSSLIQDSAETILQTQSFRRLEDGRVSRESYSIGGSPLTDRIDYCYDDDKNVYYITKDGIERVSYIWSYNGTYPIAKVEGLTYRKVIAVLTASFISELSKKATPTDSDYDTLRTKLVNAGALVTTYRYEPLVGVTEITTPDGVSTHFEYDGFGRLVRTSDKDGRTISTNSYHYEQ